MKNKVSLLMMVTAVMLSACGAKNESKGVSVAERFAKISKDTKLGSDVGDDLKIENKDGKWQYKLTSADNKELVFGADEFKEEDGFQVTEFKKMKQEIDGQIKEVETQFKIPSNQSYLDYGHYGLVKTKDGDKLVDQEFFYAFDTKKRVDFEKPEQELNFSGTTHAVLTTIKTEGAKKVSVNDLSGTANMKIGADGKGDLEFKYKGFEPTVKAKGLDFVNKTDFNWSIDGYKVDEVNSSLNADFFGKDGKPEEMLGKYGILMKKGTDIVGLDGAFGMKKQ